MGRGGSRNERRSHKHPSVICLLSHDIRGGQICPSFAADSGEAARAGTGPRYLKAGPGKRAKVLYRPADLRECLVH
jgi:hypothetical protein